MRRMHKTKCNHRNKIVHETLSYISKYYVYERLIREYGYVMDRKR